MLEKEAGKSLQMDGGTPHFKSSYAQKLMKETTAETNPEIREQEESPRVVVPLPGGYQGQSQFAKKYAVTKTPALDDYDSRKRRAATPTLQNSAGGSRSPGGSSRSLR